MLTLLVIAAVALLVAMNALFVATEFALVAARPSHLSKMIEEGSRAAVLADRARQALRLQMSGAQLGITVSSVAVGILAEPALGRFLEKLFVALTFGTDSAHVVSWILAIVIAAFVQMLFGEMIPKNVAIAEPERTLRWTIIWHSAFVRVAKPLVIVVDRVAALIIRAFGLTPVDAVERAVGAAELSAVFKESRRDGLIESFELELLSGALDLGQRKVLSVMMLRDKVVTVDCRSPVHEVERIIGESGLSRIPLRDADGGLRRFVHARRLLGLPVAAQDEALTMESTRPLMTIDPALPLDDALRLFRHERERLAVVHDPKDPINAWMGVVSLEDVVEELVGDIRDETDLKDG